MRALTAEHHAALRAARYAAILGLFPHLSRWFAIGLAAGAIAASAAHRW